MAARSAAERALPAVFVGWDRAARVWVEQEAELELEVEEDERALAPGARAAAPVDLLVE